MALSNHPPGVTDADIDAHFGEDDDEQEEAHYRFCAVNTSGRACDCMEDS